MITAITQLWNLGLLEVVEAAGCRVWHADGVTHSSDDVAVQAIVDSYTVAEAIAYKQLQIDEHAKAIRAAFMKANSAGEESAWATKLEEAQKYTTDPIDGTQAQSMGVYLLYVEATARGVTTGNIAARVLANAIAYKGFEGTVAGNAGKHKDAVALLTTFAEVAAYNYMTGWPAPA